MTDILDTVKAALSEVAGERRGGDERAELDYLHYRHINWLRALVAEVERLREVVSGYEKDLASLRDELEDERLESRWTTEEHRKAIDAITSPEPTPPIGYPSMQERVWWKAAMETIAALRQRHAEAVEKAFREGFDAGNLAACKASAGYGYLDHNAAWLASEAKKGLT